MPLPVARLIEVLSEYPHLTRKLEFDDVVKFSELVYLLKLPLSLLQSPYDQSSLPTPPVYILDFIRVALRLERNAVKLLWEVLRDAIWDEEWDEEVHRQLGHRYVPLFLEHGQSRNLPFFFLLPPTRVCLDPNCTQPVNRSKNALHRRRELTEPSEYDVTVFTHDFGPVPGALVSLYCRGCHTRYYPNYYVHDKATTRTYYTSPPRYIQCKEHSFVDRKTCEIFSSMMVNAGVSASNCARVFNDSIANKTVQAFLSSAYRLEHKLDAESVWDALFLFWLLEDSVENDTVLKLDHQAPSQADRLNKGLYERNLRMVGTGQEHWNHACDLCSWIKKSEDGGEGMYLGLAVLAHS
ncbi:hypothetical protein CC1G_01061 [Coprinopsis cinerea okayama7|uniref:CxC5 like cysteine cluster associated with KDZ domain-containing protein n=1 Tax=Coprinopsis cinerea (strain Okayama-7 / 130 / ATCC MYA-4618 / FGSC 9003) TaxID=240176 RepID=A8NED8_COPC7|nr:hypothetical protein CC1G_01061 [Coprinopsis cinerea okayama7\|eukprot:XP_001832999.2 hypothetical protein CC1G_01061 [Coprinopsis cinerea okayama7\